MKNTRCRLETRVPFDVQGIEAHLARMAAQGWRLEKTGAFLWRYRRAEPARVRYAVACAPVEREDGNLRDRLFFQELCASAGWERVTDLFHFQSYARTADGLQVFCTEAADSVPLETDEALRLKRIHQAMKRTYLVQSGWMLFWTALCLGFQVYELRTMPRVFFLYGTALFQLPVYLLLLLFALLRIVGYCRWYARSRRSVEAGGEPVPVSRACRALELLTWGMLAVLPAGLFPLELVSRGTPVGTALGMFLFALAVMVVAVLGAFLLFEYMERRGLERESRVAVFLLCGVLLAVLFGRRWDPMDSFSHMQEVEDGAYRWQGQVWDKEPAPIPLSTEDLTGRPWPHIRRTSGTRGGFLVKEFSYGETVRQEDGEGYTLRYSLLRTDAGWVYGLLRADCLDRHEPWAYQPEDPIPWRAEAAYRLYRSGVPEGSWLVFWPGCILDMDTELSLTPEQMSVTAVRLAPEAGEEEPQ